MEEVKGAFFVILLFVTFLVYLLISPETKNAKDYPSKTWEKDLLLKEYEILNGEIERRERSMIMMGSIFLPTSFLLLGQAAMIPKSESVFWDARFLLALVSVTLYSIWLFAVQYTSWWLHEITYARLHWLEENIGFEAHKFLKKRIEKEGKRRINYLRRLHWAYFLFPLFLAAIAVILA